MNNRVFFALLFLLGPATLSFSQNREYAESTIDKLAGPEFHGRGYTNDGALKAADYIKAEMIKNGIESHENGFYHHFSLKVNTFPNDIFCSVDSKELTVGRDYIVNPKSGDFQGSMPSYFLSSNDLLIKKKRRKAIRKTKKKRILVLDTIPAKSKSHRSAIGEVRSEFKGKALIELNADLTWSTGREQLPHASLRMLPENYKRSSKVMIDVDAEFIPNQKAVNVLGLIPGTAVPDSFIFLTGHYDHLGDMGQTYIPGANDNASGIAMILDMVKHYKAHPPRYTIVFIAFSGEEAGLVGSYFFVKELKEWFEPSKIKFVVNMDLMGSGQQGIMAVNGKIYKGEFELLKGLNDEKNYLTKVKKRGKAANSDHYYFSENGIPAFFFYLMGPYSYYHEIDDSPENLELDEYYDKSFLLIRDFIDALQKN